MSLPNGTEALTNLINLNPRAADILLLLSSASNRYGVAMMSHKVMAQYMQVTTRTVTRAIRFM